MGSIHVRRTPRFFSLPTLVTWRILDLPYFTAINIYRISLFIGPLSTLANIPGRFYPVCRPIGVVASRVGSNDMDLYSGKYSPQNNLT